MITADHVRDVTLEMKALERLLEDGSITQARRALASRKLERLSAWMERTAEERKGLAANLQAKASVPAHQRLRLPRQRGRMTINAAAIHVLRESGRPMSVEEIFNAITASGLARPANMNSLVSMLSQCTAVRRISLPPPVRGVYALNSEFPARGAGDAGA